MAGEPYGAGFAEIDEELILISAFAATLVKQIIADLARPMLIISTLGRGHYHGRVTHIRRPHRK
ncbi:hypothetical protein N7516_005523 [Penicillium verrucosum]|uniref:uncharacterized protein n=1 Tax=Penicillium verrucosum TaxID=60171 RepID=UPI002545922D|nr:uncharacterized protein N7516_005523 [Penicillium verrucosum]KAJ5945355.1 hypothetical protein N7516_005523 [Penicillium verrucosum]